MAEERDFSPQRHDSLERSAEQSLLFQLMKILKMAVSNLALRASSGPLSGLLRRAGVPFWLDIAALSSGESRQNFG